MLRVIAAVVLAITAGATPAAAATTDAVRSAIAAGIAAVRDRAGVAALAPDATLDAIARAHSEDQVKRGYRGHRDPQGRGSQARVLAAMPDFCCRTGENIGLWGSSDPIAEADAAEIATDIVGRWLASPPHRANLLSLDFDRYGLGVAFDGDDVVVTLAFAGP